MMLYLILQRLKPLTQRLKKSNIFFWLNLSLVLINLGVLIYAKNFYSAVGAVFCSGLVYMEWKRDNIRLGY